MREDWLLGIELNMAGFKSKDQDLFFKIANDVSKSPERYCSAGKWLDRYYNCDGVPTAEQKEDAIEIVNRIEDTTVIDIAAVMNQSPSHTQFIQLEELFLSVSFCLAIWARLACALEDLFADYQQGGTLASEDASVVLLITWLATCPEANKIQPGLTKFASLPWKVKGDSSVSRRHGLATFLFFDYDMSKHYKGGGNPTYELDLNYLPLIRAAWVKLESEKEYTPQNSSDSKKNISWQGGSAFMGAIEYAQFDRSFRGFESKLLQLLAEDIKRRVALPKELIITVDNAKEKAIPEEINSYFLESLKGLNDLV